MLHPTFMHIYSSLPLYLLVHSICQSALFRCTSAEISALALAAIILLSVQRALHYGQGALQRGEMQVASHNSVFNKHFTTLHPE